MGIIWGLDRGLYMGFVEVVQGFYRGLLRGLIEGHIAGNIGVL